MLDTIATTISKIATTIEMIIATAKTMQTFMILYQWRQSEIVMLAFLPLRR